MTVRAYKNQVNNTSYVSVKRFCQIIMMISMLCVVLSCTDDTSENSNNTNSTSGGSLASEAGNQTSMNNSRQIKLNRFVFLK